MTDGIEAVAKEPMHFRSLDEFKQHYTTEEPESELEGKSEDYRMGAMIARLTRRQ